MSENYSSPKPLEGELRRIADHPESVLNEFIRGMFRQAADEIERLRKLLPKGKR